MMKRLLRMLTMVSAMALMAVACGSTDSQSESATLSNTEAGEESGDGDDSSEGEEGGDDTVFDSDDIELPTDVGDIPGLSDECEAIANVFLSMSTAFLGGGAIDADLSSFDKLPGELQDDAATVVSALNKLYAGLESLGVDLSDPTALASLTADQAATFAQIGEGLDTAEFDEASENLSNYAEAECDQYDLG